METRREAPEESGAGALRERVLLRRPARSPDAIGGTPVGWEEIATVWASVEAVEAGEAVALQAARPETQWRIVMRWRADVRAGWSLAWNGRVMSVTGARPMGRGRRLALSARETGSGS